jgi:hypothetical protein
VTVTSWVEDINGGTLGGRDQWREEREAVGGRTNERTDGGRNERSDGREVAE